MTIYRVIGSVGAGSRTIGHAQDVSVEDAGDLLTSTNVEDALQEIATDIDNHIADTVDAHDASAISNIPAGGVAATTVQAAIDELDADKVPESDFSAFGKTLVDDADASTARTTLGKDNHFYTGTITPASDADVTLTSAQYKLDRLRLVDGSWTTGHQIIVPNEVRRYYVDNTDGTYTATVITAAGTGIDVLPGTSQIVVCNGTNVLEPESHYDSLLAEYEVSGGAVTSIEFTGLDIRVHKSYTIQFELINATSSTFAISMFVDNGGALDTTVTNYYYQTLLSNGASATSLRANSASILALDDVIGQASTGVITLHKTNTLSGNGIPMAESFFTRSHGSIVQNQTMTWTKTADVDNITQIRFTSTVASAIGNGSKIRIYRGDV